MNLYSDTCQCNTPLVYMYFPHFAQIYTYTFTYCFFLNVHKFLKSLTLKFIFHSQLFGLANDMGLIFSYACTRITFTSNIFLTFSAITMKMYMYALTDGVFPLLGFEMCEMYKYLSLRRPDIVSRLVGPIVVLGTPVLH